MDAEQLFLENVDTIERIAAFVCRRSGVRDDDAAEEFASEAKFRLLENGYAIIRKFEGRSSFSTYLTTVITRLFYQCRVEEWGKWRPSAEAKRLGNRAITLEQFVTRDGFSFDEAVEILTSRAGAGYSRAELEAIWLRLPPRLPRPTLVSEEASAETSSSSTADEALLSRERERTARKAVGIIDGVIRALPAEDQMILRMRFWEERRVPDIARRLHLDQKWLYKRLDRLKMQIKRALEDAGINHEDIIDVLHCGDGGLK